MENEKSTGNKYTVKDAAIIGIFCAVMFVVFMVYSTLTGASLFYSMIFNAAVEAECMCGGQYPKRWRLYHNGRRSL